MNVTDLKNARAVAGAEYKATLDQLRSAYIELSAADIATVAADTFAGLSQNAGKLAHPEFSPVDPADDWREAVRARRDDLAKSIDLGDLRAQRQAAGATYAAALERFRVAFITLAAIEGALTRLGEVVRSFDQIPSNAGNFYHPEFAPANPGDDWCEAVTSRRDQILKQIMIADLLTAREAAGKVYATAVDRLRESFVELAAIEAALTREFNGREDYALTFATLPQNQGAALEHPQFAPIDPAVSWRDQIAARRDQLIKSAK
ncbi:MAG: hypothetical protein ACR652_00795 [Methylocystis sp.]|uniref:hypothetical protein n=1 Tax=Methylocystis sp. TaxID=1911079 RepID=UPI003DA28BDD